MKRFFLSIITLFMMIALMPVTKAVEKPEVTDHEKITIYIFRGNGCGHCANAISYFYSLGEEYDDYFEVKTYEVWHNAENDSLSEAVADKLEHDLTGVPFIVVGEKFVGGFGESTGEKLVKYALDYYQDDKYKDIVKETLDEKDYSVEETTLLEAYNEEIDDSDSSNEGNVDNYNTSAESGKYDTIIIIGIFVVLIGGITGLIIAGKK